MTLFILLVGLLICFLTVVQYPIGLLKKKDGNETTIPSKLFEPSVNQPTTNENLFDELGRYIIQDYDALSPFSDFLPASIV
jgi:hypothetical protein